MKRCLAIMALVMCVAVYASEATIIDLKTFSDDPANTVSVAPDGLSATVYESSSVCSVFFYNGAITVPADSGFLTLEYEFLEGSGNDDEVDIYLYDSSGPNMDPLTAPGGTTYQVFLNSSGSGRVDWDISGASFLGQTVGLEIDLNSMDMSVDSHVKVSNVNISPVPEPSTFLLIIAGLGGIIACRRTRAGRMS